MDKSINEQIEDIRVILNGIIKYEVDVCGDDYGNLVQYLEIDISLKEILEG